MANRILDYLLGPTDIGIEFGSGRSTLWFAKKVKRLISVEHNEVWYKRIKTLLFKHSVSNVEYLYIPCNPNDKIGNDLPEYVKILERFEN
jgi:hypothetical protein